MTIISKTMGADLYNFSSRLNVPFDKSITEAVVNSIQANADKIRVKINFKNSNLSSVKIYDNGEGFIEKNIHSFFTLHSSLKKTIGGKGVGRVAWFQFFESVKVTSVFREENEFVSLNFLLLREKNNTEIVRDGSQASKPETMVALESYYGQGMLPFNAEHLKQKLLDELLLMLIAKHNVQTPIKISIEIFEDECLTSTETISHSDLPTISKRHPFKISFFDRTYDFDLFCIHDKLSKKNSVTTAFIANERAISNFKETLGLEISTPTQRFTGKYIFLLQSELFNDNKYSTEGRNKIFLPEGNNFYGKSPKKELKTEVSKAIQSFFGEVVPEYANERDNVLNSIYDLYPQYSQVEYTSILDTILCESIGHINKRIVLQKLSEHSFNKEYQFKTELEKLIQGKHISPQKQEKILRMAQRTSEQAKGVLANYFWYRKAIVEQLETLSINKEKSEEALHELFFERNAVQNEASLRNCLWLLDDKFMTFSYFASEAIMKSIVNEIYGEHDEDYNSKKRADLFIKYDRPENASLIDCVVIEFKALGADVDERANAASQVRRKYASYIKKHIPNVNNIFIYIITELDDLLYSNLLDDDFSDLYSRHGKIMTYYNRNNQAHIYVIGVNTIVKDSKDRHELFFKLLQEELSEERRTI